jgi:TPR repeat protein
MLGLGINAASSLLTLVVASAGCTPGSTARDGLLNGCVASEYEDARVRRIAVQRDGSQAEIEEWRRRADRGEPSAQLALGTVYALGRVVERDLTRAVAWLTRAAEAGNTTAQYNLGILHVALGEFGDAHHWFVIASKRGDEDISSKALFSTQMMYLSAMRQELLMAERDAGDWMEEFDANPRANSTADQRLEFSRLRVPDSRLGWRDRAVALRSAARDSLGMPK